MQARNRGLARELAELLSELRGMLAQRKKGRGRSTHNLLLLDGKGLVLEEGNVALRNCSRASAHFLSIGWKGRTNDSKLPDQLVGVLGAEEVHKLHVVVLPANDERDLEVSILVEHASRLERDGGAAKREGSSRLRGGWGFEEGLSA